MYACLPGYVVSYQLCLDLDLGVCELGEGRLVVPQQRPRLLTLRLRTKHPRLASKDMRPGSQHLQYMRSRHPHTMRCGRVICRGTGDAKDHFLLALHRSDIHLQAVDFCLLCV